MLQPQSIAELGALVLTREQFIARGWSERALLRAKSSGAVLQLSRTHAIVAEDWQSLWPEGQLLARVIAAAPLQRGSGWFCRESAAVLHGLPLYRCVGQRPQLLLPGARSATSTARIVRCTGSNDPGDLGAISGIPCTSLERTLLDLARFSSRDTALGCIDHALRQRFPRSRGAPLTVEMTMWLEEMGDRLAAVRGRRGTARATRLLRLADAGAESVQESVARLRFIDLGYEVRTQVAVPGRNGNDYYADLELVGLDVLVEIDGRVKYTDPALRNGRSAEEIVLSEKRRDDWFRGRTGKRVLHLMAPDYPTPARLRQVLRGHDVPPPRAS